MIVIIVTRPRGQDNPESHSWSRSTTGASKACAWLGARDRTPELREAAI